jgi:hypothetical protein
MTYPIYYSAFPDVDVAFGSSGSFFDSQLPPGVALCCPPSDAAFLDCSARFITAMSQRDDCRHTSFVVVVPDWPHHVAASSKCHALLQSNALKFSSGGRTFSCLRRQGGVSKVAVLPVDKGSPAQRSFQSKFGVQLWAPLPQFFVSDWIHFAICRYAIGAFSCSHPEFRFDVMERQLGQLYVLSNCANATQF